MHDLYNPYDHARELGLRVVTRELDDGQWGQLHLPSRTIVVDRWLCQSERRSTVAHEVVHFERRDACHQPERVERDVHRIAAHRLVCTCELLRVLPSARSWRELAEEWWIDDETAQVRVHTMTEDERETARRRVRDAEGAA